MKVGLPPVEWVVNVWFGLFRLFISMTSASHTSMSSSELVLHLSSVNRGADICDKLELESYDLGRGMRGVISLCDAAGTAGTGDSCILAAPAWGGVDWHLSGDVCTGICGWCWPEPVSKVVFSTVSPSSFSIFVGFLLGLVLVGRLNPSDSFLLLVTLVLEDMTIVWQWKILHEMHKTLI